MYCQKCGAQVPDDVKFCTSCGAKLDETVQQVKATAEPKGRALIVPAILAALALLYSLYSIIVTQISFSSYGNSSFFIMNRINSLVSGGFTIAAALFVFLFCIVQAKKCKTSLFGVACLMLVLRGVTQVVFPFIMTLPHVRAVAAQSAAVSGIVSILLQLAVIVLFLIAMILAFKGRIAKVVVIIGACALILLQIVPSLLTMAHWTVAITILPNLLLPVAILLCGALYRSKDA